MEYVDFNNLQTNNIYLSEYTDKSIFNSNAIEFWTPITGRSCPGVIEGRYFISSFGNTFNVNTGKPIGLSMHMKGYWQLLLAKPGSKRVCRKLHRVMMFEFCYFPGCEAYEINHIDGVKTNNALWNLEWCTHSENTIHAINNGLKTVFGNNYKVLLTDEQVGVILDLYNKGYNEYHILYKLGLVGKVSEVTIGNICRGHARVAYHKDLYNQHS